MGYFNRGDEVSFKGNAIYKAKPKTFVWAALSRAIPLYVIEHEDGYEKAAFMAKPPFPDGFEAIHSSELEENITYIYVKAEEIELLNEKK